MNAVVWCWVWCGDGCGGGGGFVVVGIGDGGGANLVQKAIKNLSGGVNKQQEEKGGIIKHQ